MFSTLGQPNWLGAYLAINFFLALGYYLESRKEKPNKGKELNQIIDGMPKYCTLKSKKQFEKGEYDKIINSIEIYYSNKNYRIKSRNDSIKAVVDKNSFVWFRASKTEAGIFRIIADSNNREKAEELLNEAVGVFENAKRAE